MGSLGALSDFDSRNSGTRGKVDSEELCPVTVSLSNGTVDPSPVPSGETTCSSNLQEVCRDDPSRQRTLLDSTPSKCYRPVPSQTWKDPDRKIYFRLKTFNHRLQSGGVSGSPDSCVVSSPIQGLRRSLPKVVRLLRYKVRFRGSQTPVPGGDENDTLFPKE